jgi:hypothetical protein
MKNKTYSELDVSIIIEVDTLESVSGLRNQRLVYQPNMKSKSSDSEAIDKLNDRGLIDTAFNTFQVASIATTILTLNTYSLLNTVDLISYIKFIEYIQYFNFEKPANLVLFLERFGQMNVLDQPPFVKERLKD